MELWIRSQDKKQLVKVNNVYVVDYNGYYFVASEINGDEITLGKYEFHNSTRALEVLDEIQKLMIASLIDKNLDDYGVVICEMPKE